MANQTPKEKKPEPEVVSAVDQCIVELVELLAQACGGQVLLDGEASPHLTAHVQRVTGKGPVLPVLAPAGPGRAKGDD